MSETEEPKRTWERTLIETIVGFVLIGVLGWMAITLQQMTIDVAVIKAELATANRDRFSAMEGQALAERVKRLEDKLDNNQDKDSRR